LFWKSWSTTLPKVAGWALSFLMMLVMMSSFVFDSIFSLQ